MKKSCQLGLIKALEHSKFVSLIEFGCVLCVVVEVIFVVVAVVVDTIFVLVVVFVNLLFG